MSSAAAHHGLDGAEASVDVSIVLPRYGETLNELRWTVARIDEASRAHGVSVEIILVDDSGRGDLRDRDLPADRSGAIHRVEVLTNPRNYGKGYSIRRGALHSAGAFVAFTDSDLPVEPSLLFDALRLLEGGEADVVVGDRYSRMTITHGDATFHRRMSSRIFRGYTRMFVLGGINDFQCPMKVMKRSAALAVFSRQRVNGYAFDVEVLYLLQQLGFRIHSVPVVWSDVRAPWSIRKTLLVLVRMLFDVTRVRLGSMLDQIPLGGRHRAQSRASDASSSMKGTVVERQS